MGGIKWIERWNHWIAPRPAMPGVWRRRDGGCLVRGRVKDPRTGKSKEVLRALPGTTVAAAFAWLQGELDKVRTSHVDERPGRLPRWGDYATTLLEAKVTDGSIKGRRTRINWESMLKQHLVPAFGALRVDLIRRADVIACKNRLASLVKRGTYSPVTVNNILRLFGTITNSAYDEFEIDRRNPALRLPYLDTSEHVTYTEEEPNSLTVPEMRVFLSTMRERHPQHFGMVALGFATGLRPSSLRPLRRQGPTPDVRWDDSVLLVRRSHSYGTEAMQTTKTGRRQTIPLPKDLMQILRWHDARLPGGPMKESDLLFPSVAGGFRASSCLAKPFADVSKHMKMGKHITPRAMRRTFQDLARAAQMNEIVTRAISGHATEEMHRHYSTVGNDEIREGLARVVSLAGFREALATEAGPSGGQSGGQPGESEEVA